MTQDQRERWGLWLCLTALVLTGGATAPWRLTLVALPLMVFQPPLRLVIPAALFVLLPSAAELLIHGNWVGPFGGRLRLLAGVLVAGSAMAFGVRLRQSRELRKAFAVALPVLAFGLLVQAGLRLLDAVPEAWQYLSGNNLSALLTALLVPALSLHMRPAGRLVLVTLLVIALIATGSRWGLWCGIVFGLLMVASISKGRLLVFSRVFLLVAVAAPWMSLGLIDIEKGGMVRALGQAAFLRPLTGLGPGGSEQVSLQFVERTSRLTHVESLGYDWAANFGWPFAIILVVGLIALAFAQRDPTESRSVERLQQLAGVGIIALLCHDLLDFSLSSGALTVGLGMLCGLAWPMKRWLIPRTGPAVLFIGLTLSALAAAHHFEPLRMEAQDRLDTLDERWGQRPFRYWANSGRQATRLGERVSAFSNALSIAPGYRELWFELGDALVRSGLQQQGLLAYRRGLEAAKPDWTGTASNAIAQLPLDLIPRAIGDHLGAARSVAYFRAKGDAKDLRLVGRLDRKHQDRNIRAVFLKGLLRKDLPCSFAVPELWRLATSKPLVINQGMESLSGIRRCEPRVRPADLFLRMVRVDYTHCRSLAAWPEDEIAHLHHIAEQLDQICRSRLTGHGPALRVLARVRELSSP